MPRQRTGTVKLHGDHYDARITLPDGSRPWIHLPAGLSEARARDRATSLSETARRENATRAPKANGAAPAPAGETCAAWSERWCAAREERGLTSVNDDRGRLRKWVLPHLGPRPMVEIKRLDLERLVEELDAAVRAELLSWKTARNAWGIVSKMFDDACRSKTLALRVLTENPCAAIRGPDEGVKKSKSYVYPTEFARLVACPRVPIRWRRLFAVAIYTYTRAGELEALEKEDVDLDAMVIHVHRAIDRSEDGAVKETKTNNPRRMPIEAPLVPLLRVLFAESTGRRLVDMPPACDLSARLRQYLEWAGVTRAELFAGDKTRKAITFHDLRATGITWMAIRGDEPIKIMRRAGHENIATTMGYVREAENLVTPVGEPFPMLPPELTESSAESSEGPAKWGLLRESTYKKRGVPSGIRTRVTALKGLGPGPD
jgi:integrase